MSLIYPPPLPSPPSPSSADNRYRPPTRPDSPDIAQTLVDVSFRHCCSSLLASHAYLQDRRTHKAAPPCRFTYTGKRTFKHERIWHRMYAHCFCTVPHPPPSPANAGLLFLHNTLLPTSLIYRYWATVSLQYLAPIFTPHPHPPHSSCHFLSLTPFGNG